MPDEAFDVAVIGGGSAGYVGAIRGAQLGLKVAVIEKEKVGGTCLHRGCIPTKSFLHSSELAHQIHGAGVLGLKADGLQVDWPAVLKRKEAVVNQLWRGTEFLLKKNKVTVFKGEAMIDSEHSVTIKDSGQAINAKNLVVATGSRPKSLPGLKMDGDRVINSDHAVNLEQMPKSIVIVGAGAVGTEFACVYNGYGAEVTLVEFLPTLLPQEDAEVGQQLAKILGKRGIKIMTGAQVQPETMKRVNGRMTVTVKTGAETQTIEGERLLVAVGREGITDGFGLEKLDIQIEKGFIKTDEHYRTGHPNVYAAGDVIGNYLLAHVAYYEGEHIMEVIAGKNPKPLDYNRVPRATYSYPQVASLGLSEKQASDQGLKVKVGKFPLVGNAKSVILGETEGFVKIISAEDSDELVGVFILGPNATELIAEAALGKLLESTPFEIGASIAPHPTVSESVKEAALAVDGVAIHI
jgi:dihydrolipoamide dehydrogenase